VNDELSCQEVEHLADKLDVEYSVIARAANKVGVRQRLCQWAPFCVCPPSSHRRRKPDDVPSQADPTADAGTEVSEPDG
jgi:hypothetical protein